MNIFVLDYHPRGAAQMHCDKHVVKMVLESAQILSTVHHLYESEYSSRVYKPTHKSHPSVKWAAKSWGNYWWLYNLFDELAREYTHRYNKVHKSWELLKYILGNTPRELTDDIGNTGVTQFALAMPDVYKFVSDDPVECYRAYYMHDKADMLTYTNRARPRWMTKTP